MKIASTLIQKVGRMSVCADNNYPGDGWGGAEFDKPAVLILDRSQSRGLHSTLCDLPR